MHSIKTSQGMRQEKKYHKREMAEELDEFDSYKKNQKSKKKEDLKK